MSNQSVPIEDHTLQVQTLFVQHQQAVLAFVLSLDPRELRNLAAMPEHESLKQRLAQRMPVVNASRDPKGKFQQK